MKYALPLMILSTPALAHGGAHMHPHGSEGWIVGLALVVLVGVATFALKSTK